MLLKTKDRNVDSFGATESAQFKISTAGGKAFRILIDRLYSDKIGAPVRELCTNAYDSHCLAGIPDKPFSVKVPNEFDPEFAVRDYGVSMDHATVMGLYSTVFESTKEDTNEQVGMFGLGSKSPFAYTDVFTVETFLNGERRLYSCYAGKDGTPRTDLMGVYQDKEEPNGVRVSFPVEPADIPFFQRAITRVARGFDVWPETNDDSVLEPLRNLETMLEGKGWAVYSPLPHTTPRASVRQGCVIYPLDAEALFPLGAIEGGLVSMNMIVDMPIGSVDITADREKLAYDDETIANIKARLEEIGKEVIQSVEESIAKCKTYGEAVKLRNELCRNSFNHYFQDTVFGKVKFRGRPMRAQVGIPHGVPRLLPLRQRVMRVSASDLMYGRSSRSSVWNARWQPNDAHVNPVDTIYYIEKIGGDTKVTHAGIRLREDFKDRRLNKQEHWGNCVWIKYATEMELKRLLVCYGRPSADQIVDLAKLPKPSVAVNRGGRSTVMCKEVIITSKRLQDLKVESDEEGIVYIATRRNSFVDHRHDLTTRTICEWAEYLMKKGYIDHDAKIVQIPATHAKLIEKNKDIWTNFFDVVDACVAAEFTTLGYAYHSQWNEIRPTDRSAKKAWTLARAMAKAGDFPKKRGDLWELVKRARVLLRAKERFGHDKIVDAMHNERNPTFDLATAINTTPQLVDADDVTAYSAAVYTAYPLLQYAISEYNDHVDLDVRGHLLRYINAMDAAE